MGCWLGEESGKQILRGHGISMSRATSVSAMTSEHAHDSMKRLQCPERLQILR